jgi:hypothetical protein
LEKAEELARKPISFGEGRSHNLLGHIYFMKGLFEKVHLQQVSESRHIDGREIYKYVPTIVLSDEIDLRFLFDY